MGVPQETVVPRDLELLRHANSRTVVPSEPRTASSPAIFTAHVAEFLAGAGDLLLLYKSEQTRALYAFTLWLDFAERICQQQRLMWSVLRQ
jgi:hypothetical protein